MHVLFVRALFTTKLPWQVGVDAAVSEAQFETCHASVWLASTFLMTWLANTFRTTTPFGLVGEGGEEPVLYEKETFFFLLPCGRQLRVAPLSKNNYAPMIFPGTLPCLIKS